MENSVKSSLKYIIGIITLLLILAAVFFGLANKKPAFDSDYVMQLMDDNKSLTVELEIAKSKNTEYESTIILLEQAVEETMFNPSTEPDDSSDNSDEVLAACLIPDDVLDVQKNLIDMQSDFISCTNELNTTKSELSELVQTNENLQSTLDNSQLVEFETRVLEDKLATINLEYTELENRFNALLLQNEELIETFNTSGPLAFSNFTLDATYCDEQIESELVCVNSIDINAEFNFQPTNDITVTLINPIGEVIGRRVVEAKEENSIQFRTDADDSLLYTGLYTVEFKIDDEFEEDRSFDIVRP